MQHNLNIQTPPPFTYQPLRGHATAPIASLDGHTRDKLSRYVRKRAQMGKLLTFFASDARRPLAGTCRPGKLWKLLSHPPVLGPEACSPGLPDLVHPEVAQAPNAEIGLPMVQ